MKKKPIKKVFPHKKLGAAPVESGKKKLFARDYNTRQDLQLAVGKLVSLNPDPKDYELLGTRKELARLQLSDRTSFYGISCVISDLPTPVKVQAEKPARGEKFEHNIK